MHLRRLFAGLCRRLCTGACLIKQLCFNCILCRSFVQILWWSFLKSELGLAYYLKESNPSHAKHPLKVNFSGKLRCSEISLFFHYLKQLWFYCRKLNIVLNVRTVFSGTYAILLHNKDFPLLYKPCPCNWLTSRHSCNQTQEAKEGSHFKGAN